MIKLYGDDVAIKTATIGMIPKDLLVYDDIRKLLAKEFENEKNPPLLCARACYSLCQENKYKKSNARKALAYLISHYKNLKINSDDPEDPVTVFILALTKLTNKDINKVFEWNYTDWQKAVSEMPED